jgi:ParB family transcriptional regulator, chromosome partitioning protein
MAETVKLVDPRHLERNPENPRLIFRQEELDALQASIAEQGILVPLTVFRDNKSLILLDGERRWRCALKLGLSSVPVIIQPKPDRLQNIMMMFAIHNARKDWDPLPTALKLQELEKEFQARNNRRPTEIELAGLASLSRGEVRRLKKLLSLPKAYRQELLNELEKPKAEQIITVDHVLETTKGAEALQKRKIIDRKEEDSLRRAIIEKFRTKVETNTVAPRMLARLGRAIDRGEVSTQAARQVTIQLIKNPTYSIEDAFQQSVEQADYEYSLEQLASRLISRLAEYKQRGYSPSLKAINLLRELVKQIITFIGE